MVTENRYIKIFGPVLKALDKDRARAEGAASLVEGYGVAIMATRERIEEARVLASKVLKSRQGEVVYFREVWPRIFGSLFFYQRAHAFYMERLALSRDGLAAMIRREELEAARYFRVHREFWVYYSGGSAVIDGQFTREYSRGCVYDPLCGVIDPDGATLASYRAAWGVAYERYIHFLSTEKLKATHSANELGDIAGYAWQGSDADAVEWLYSLHAGNVILHNGEPADIMQLSRWFRGNFRKEIVNIYDRFKAVRNRKKDRAPFMRRLLGGLEKRMDEAEGRFE